MTSIAVYFAPLLLMRILWIGAVDDQSQAEAELESETNGFAEWRAVNPDYADWLERACQGGGGGAP